MSEIKVLSQMDDVCELNIFVSANFFGMIVSQMSNFVGYLSDIS